MRMSRYRGVDIAESLLNSVAGVSPERLVPCPSRPALPRFK